MQEKLEAFVRSQDRQGIRTSEVDDAIESLAARVSQYDKENRLEEWRLAHLLHKVLTNIASSISNFEMSEEGSGVVALFVGSALQECLQSSVHKVRDMYDLGMSLDTWERDQAHMCGAGHIDQEALEQLRAIVDSHTPRMEMLARKLEVGTEAPTTA